MVCSSPRTSRSGCSRATEAHHFSRGNTRSNQTDGCPCSSIEHVCGKVIGSAGLAEEGVRRGCSELG